MSPLADQVQAVFSARGTITAHDGFTFRPQQAAMALAIADALIQGFHLLMEVPTGVGKSLAYLLPVALHACGEQRKAVISTFTKNLQEQLILKDLPMVRALINLPFTAAVFKGRRNYLCKTRLYNLLGQTANLLDDEETHIFKRVFDWSLTTSDGERDHAGFNIPHNLWSLVCSIPEACSSRICGSDCFYQKMLERVRMADIVIMNHALFFTLLGRQEEDEGIISRNRSVVLDEAHTIESVAAANLGTRISRSQVLSAVHRLYHPASRRGLLSQDRTVRSLCGAAEKAVHSFFDFVVMAAKPKRSEEREVRIRQRHICANTVDEPIRRLEERAEKLRPRSESEEKGAELAAACHALEESRALITEFLEQRNSDCAYWVDLDPARNTTLCSAPVHVGTILRQVLFRDGSPVILTSASLSVDGSLNYIGKRIGAEGASFRILDSPFDYSRQMVLCFAQGIPSPDDDRYAQVLPLWISRCIERSGGRALVLFTNAGMMRTVAQSLQQLTDGKDFTLLVQSDDLPRQHLLEQFKRDTTSVLLGLDSFWMGVDVPGESLEHVIITKLPFPAPGHPLTEAKLEMIREQGGNDFLEYVLPECILKLRQGVGRLIRASTDSGHVTILDARILTKSYGRSFIRSLPRCRLEVMTPEGYEELEAPFEW